MKPISNIPASVRPQKPTREQIAVAAFHLYFESGSRAGHDLDDWLRAEDLLTQALKTIAKAQAWTPNRKDTSRTLEIHVVGTREHPLAREERDSAGREEIRQKTTPYRPTFRQLQ